MDNTEKLTEKLLKLMERAEKLPPEKQLRLLWIMLSALAHDVEKTRGYQEANFNAIVQYVEACSKVEENVLPARTAIEKKLAEAILCSEELFSE